VGGFTLTSLLEVKMLNKTFGGVKAVRNLDFQVGASEIVGLIGPNGAGKTTTFNLIGGVYPPDSGSIRFNGEEITGLRPYQICKKGICRTFQIVKPFANMTVYASILIGEYFGRAKSQSVEGARQHAEEVLDFVGLSSKKDQLCKNLTLAYQRRLEIARALATKPSLLLLDEVMAGLNPSEVQEAVSMIRKIKGQGVSVLMVEHVMSAIMSVSERIVVLSNGERIAEGTPLEVQRDAKVVGAYLGEDTRFE